MDAIGTSTHLQYKSTSETDRPEETEPLNNELSLGYPFGLCNSTPRDTERNGTKQYLGFLL